MQKFKLGWHLTSDIHGNVNSAVNITVSDSNDKVIDLVTTELDQECITIAVIRVLAFYTLDLPDYKEATLSEHIYIDASLKAEAVYH